MIAISTARDLPPRAAVDDMHVVDAQATFLDEVGTDLNGIQEPQLGYAPSELPPSLEGRCAIREHPASVDTDELTIVADEQPGAVVRPILNLFVLREGLEDGLAELRRTLLEADALRTIIINDVADAGCGGLDECVAFLHEHAVLLGTDVERDNRRDWHHVLGAILDVPSEHQNHKTQRFLGICVDARCTALACKRTNVAKKQKLDRRLDPKQSGLVRG